MTSSKTSRTFPSLSACNPSFSAPTTPSPTHRIRYGKSACKPASFLKLANAAVRFAKSLEGGSKDDVRRV